VPTGSMEPTLLVGERFVADKLSYWLRSPKRSEIIAFNAPDISVCHQGYAYSKNPIKNLFERYVYGPQNWTKRVIGIPGDHVQGKVEDNRQVIYVNGKKLDEPYINKFPLIYQKLGGNTVRPVTYDPKSAYDKQPFYQIDPEQLLKDRWQNPLMIKPGASKNVFDIQLKENQYWVMGDNREGSYDSRSWGPLDASLIHGRILFRIWSLDSISSWWIVDLLLQPIDFFKRIRWSRCLQTVSYN
jgi:signal peptidase I